MKSTSEKLPQHSEYIQTRPLPGGQAIFLFLASLLCAAAPWATAATLPTGTKLTIAPSTDIAAAGGLSPCTTGSCFGMYLAPSLHYWTPLFPGTDGGIVVGKSQAPGEINAPNGNSHVYDTLPDGGAKNIFDDTSCIGSDCIGKTELKVWNMTWNGLVIPLGSARGCNKVMLTNCTDDQAIRGIFFITWKIDPDGTNPRTYELTYNQVAPAGFPNFPYELILRGTVRTCDPCAKLVADPIQALPNTKVTLTVTCETKVTGTVITACPIVQTVGTNVTLTTVSLAGIGSPTAINKQSFTPTVEEDYTFVATATRDGAHAPTNNTGSATVTVSSVVNKLPVPSTKSGCSMVQGATANPSERFDWWLVLGFITWWGMISRRWQPRA